MEKDRQLVTVQLIPIDRITVINPRIRNRKSFKDIVENVGAIGLKKPITLPGGIHPTACATTSFAVRDGSRPTRPLARTKSPPLSGSRYRGVPAAELG